MHFHEAHSVKTAFRGALCGAMLLALHQAGTITGLSAQALKQFTPYSEARPIFDALRSDLLPAELRDASTRESNWLAWARQHDAAIRARVAAGDEDSIIHLLLFGTSFTKAPRASERDLAALVASPDAALRALAPRIDDFATAIAAPGTNERLRFARRIIEKKGSTLSPSPAKQRSGAIWTNERGLSAARCSRHGSSIPLPICLRS